MKTMNWIPDTDEEFRAEYLFAFHEMMKYDPRKNVGASIWADRMALLYDARPEFCDAIEASEG